MAANGAAGTPGDHTASGSGDHSEETTVTPLPYLNRRTAPRYVFQVSTKVIMPYCEGEATIWDMSASGTRIEKSTVNPIEGEEVRIEFSFFPDSPAIQLKGEVVRKTELGGFCLRFSSLTPRIRQILVRLLPKVASSRVDPEEQVNTYSGQLVASVGPALHQACAEAAQSAGLDLKAWLKQQLETAAVAELERAQRHQAATHDPSTCPECRAKAARTR